MKLFSLFNLFLILALFVITSFTQNNWRLVLVHTGDTRSNILPVDNGGNTCPINAQDTCLGGSARLATFINQTRAKDPNMLLLDGGNVFQGTLFFYTFQAKVPAQFMNSFQYNAMAIGTHEFDLGADYLLYVFIQTLINFPVVCANLDETVISNLLYKEKNSPGFQAAVQRFVIFTINGRKVGFTSLITVNLPLLSDAFPIGAFDPIQALQSVMSSMTASGVDIVIVASLLYSRTLEQQIAETIDGVDIIITVDELLYNNEDPNSDGPYPVIFKNTNTGNYVLNIASGSFGEYVGLLNVTFDSQGYIADWDNSTSDTYPLTNATADEPSIEAIIVADNVIVQEKTSEVISTASCTITGGLVCRYEECAAGDLITDSIRMKAGVDVCLANSGSIRDSFYKGNITLGSIYLVLPFQDLLSTFKLTGRNLWLAIQHGLSAVNATTGTGRFPQVSGIKFVWNPSAPLENMIISMDILQGGVYVPIDLNANYSVSCNSYMRKGGDGYSILADAAFDVFDNGPSFNSDIISFFQTNTSNVCVTTQGRITIDYTRIGPNVNVTMTTGAIPVQVHSNTVSLVVIIVPIVVVIFVIIVILFAIIIILFKRKFDNHLDHEDTFHNSKVLEYKEGELDTLQTLVPENFPLQLSRSHFVFSQQGGQLEVGVEYKDTITLTNPSSKSIQFRILFPQTKGKYNLKINPSSGIVAKKSSIKVKVATTINCTCKVRGIVFLTANDSSKTEILLNLEGALSTRLDPDEITFDPTPIGEGSFGSVHRGEWRGQDVAVKILKYQWVDDDVMKQFDREIDLLNKLRSPYVVNFVGAVNVPGKLYLLTEFIKLGSLTSVLEKVPVGLNVRIKMMKDAAKGLEFLHACGIIHRDVKAANMLVFSIDYEAPVRIKLTDFGTSKAIDFSASNTQKLEQTVALGTPIYMSPEVLNKEPYSEKSDLFSLGVTMYEVYTQRQPYSDFASQWEIPNFVLSGRRLQFDEKCPREYVEITNKCWAQSADDRPSAGEVAKMIDELLNELEKEPKLEE